jgi:hypothetical protein
VTALWWLRFGSSYWPLATVSSHQRCILNAAVTRPTCTTLGCSLL